MLRSISMIFNQHKIYHGTWDAFNQIAESLFLGMIPTKETTKSRLLDYGFIFSEQHKKIIKFVAQMNPKRPLGLVISVVEPDELKGEGFVSIQSMVSPKDWENENVNHHLLEMADFTAGVSRRDAISTIFKMRECIVQGKSVYVHCKAGRSRSAMICAIYLAIYGTDPFSINEITLENAIEILKKKRPQVELGSDKIAKAKEIITELKRDPIYLINSAFPNANLKILNSIADYAFDDINLKDEKIEHQHKITYR